jgi:hypothetical protein
LGLFQYRLLSTQLTRGGKGLGRFTWLKAFDHAKIESIFKDDHGFHIRSFTFDESYDDDDARGLPKAVPTLPHYSLDDSQKLSSACRRVIRKEIAER